MMFSDFARAHGLLIRDLHPVSRIQRCPTANKPNGKNGAWWWDGERGWVFAWDGDAQVIWFETESRPWTPEEKRQWANRRDNERQRIAAKQKMAGAKAHQMLTSAKAEEHGYLQLKGFAKEKGMVLDGELLIPMRNVLTNELQGLQRIFWTEADRRWEKKMLAGMKAKNAVFRIGSKTPPETFLCEGYATGLSIASALRSVGSGAAVLVCFSDSNLVHVASQVSGRAFVYADNDMSGAGERAAKATSLPYCMSDTVGFDANDDFIHNGSFVVARKLMEVRRHAS